MQKKALRILYVANQYEFSIAHRLPFAAAARAQGHEVFFATPPPAKIEPDSHQGMTFIPIRMKRKGRMPITELITFLHLLKIVRDLKPDIIHNFTVKPVVYGSLAGRILKVPIVINTITGLGSVYIQRNIGNFLTQLIIGLCYRFAFRSPRVHVIFQNPDDRQLFLDRHYVSPEQTTVILGSGVDINKFTPSPEPSGTPIILYPGRMLWDKGVGDLVEAGKKLAARNYKFEIHFCGPLDSLNPSGISESDLKIWQQNFPWFKWLGNQTDMISVFRKCHIVCLPSHREGVPIALLEAAASGRAIVTTDAPGCREVVQQRVNGFKVPPENPESLAMHLAKLLEDSELRLKMATAGREIAVARFSRQHIIDLVLKVYRQMVEKELN